MSFINQFNKMMQSIMVLRTPEIEARIPEVEAMEFEDRVAIAKRGEANLHAILKSWDKFAALLAARGWEKADIKRRNKSFKAARGHLEHALRLADRSKLPPAFHSQADTAFNVLIAWFLMDAGSMEPLLTGDLIKGSNFAGISLPVTTIPADVVAELEAA